MNNLYQKEVDKIFFNSREGYFLLKLYNLMKTITDSNDLPEGIYFKTSRRMSTVSAIFNENDIYKFLEMKNGTGFPIHRFYGTLEKLLFNRFGITPDGDDDNLDKVIDTTRGTNEIRKYLERYKNKIIQNAKVERNNYLVYLNSICKEDDNVVMVDHGIYGTAQSCLEKIMNRKFIGNYMCINKNSNPNNLSNIDSFYNYDTNHFKNFIIFVESIFTAPEGTYIKCDENGKFINDKEWSNQLIFDKKISVFNGIKLFIFDMMGDLLTVKGLKLNNRLPDFIFTLLESPDIVIEDSIRKTFYHDNQFVYGGEKVIGKK